MNSFNSKKDYYVLALLDDRTGNRNQILAVLKELKLPYKTINIEYNWLANLPNFMLQFFGGFAHVKKLTECMSSEE